MYHLIFDKKTIEDFMELKESGSEKSLKKLLKLFEEIEENPRKGTGHPERLKFQDHEIWSRRIDKKNRLVYSIHEEHNKSVVIISIIGHYDDK